MIENLYIDIYILLPVCSPASLLDQPGRYAKNGRLVYRPRLVCSYQGYSKVVCFEGRGIGAERDSMGFCDIRALWPKAAMVIYRS